MTSIYPEQPYNPRFSPGDIIRVIWTPIVGEKNVVVGRVQYSRWGNYHGCGGGDHVGFSYKLEGFDYEFREYGGAKLELVK